VDPTPPPIPALTPVGAPRAARILLVDDDLINQKVMVSLIRRRGHEAVSARSGRESLALLAGQRFDLVLMDIQMPELNGFETALRIRELETRPQEHPSGAPSAPPRVPIIALTTVSEEGTRERCLAAGMDDYLTKPVNTQQLYEVIARYANPAP
jgi:two-component system, sensor histidine kinase and response regulator